MAEKIRGRIEHWNGGRGFGFIKSVGRKDTFCHVHQLDAKLRELADAGQLEGTEVLFEVGQGAKGPQAFNVEKVVVFGTTFTVEDSGLIRAGVPAPMVVTRHFEDGKEVRREEQAVTSRLAIRDEWPAEVRIALEPRAEKFEKQPPFHLVVWIGSERIHNLRFGERRLTDDELKKLRVVKTWHEHGRHVSVGLSVVYPGYSEPVALSALRDSGNLPIVQKLAELGLVYIRFCDGCKRMLLTTNPEQRVHRGDDVNAVFCDDKHNGEYHRNRWAEFRKIVERKIGRQLAGETEGEVDFFYGIRITLAGFQWSEISQGRCGRCGSILVRVRLGTDWKGERITNRCPKCGQTDERWIRHLKDGRDDFEGSSDAFFGTMALSPWEGEEVFDPVARDEVPAAVRKAEAQAKAEPLKARLAELRWFVSWGYSVVGFKMPEERDYIRAVMSSVADALTGDFPDVETAAEKLAKVEMLVWRAQPEYSKAAEFLRAIEASYRLVDDAHAQLAARPCPTCGLALREVKDECGWATHWCDGSVPVGPTKREHGVMEPRVGDLVVAKNERGELLAAMIAVRDSSGSGLYRGPRRGDVVVIPLKDLEQCGRVGSWDGRVPFQKFEIEEV